jgi:hypothetical protein
LDQLLEQQLPATIPFSEVSFTQINFCNSSYRPVLKPTLIFEEKSFVRAKATSYHPIFKVSLYLDQLLDQQLPATNKFSKRALILQSVPHQKLPATIEFLRL